MHSAVCVYGYLMCMHVGTPYRGENKHGALHNLAHTDTHCTHWHNLVLYYARVSVHPYKSRLASRVHCTHYAQIRISIVHCTHGHILVLY